MKIFLRADNTYFEGHFPGHPVLPAVAQINLVLDYLRDREGKPYRIRKVKRGKFRAFIRPEMELEVEVTDLGSERFRWVIKDENQVYSTGEIEVA